MKKKYDTSVVMLYLLRQEYLFPLEFRRKIPYSTISTWRSSFAKNYLGQEFRFLFDDNWSIIKLKEQNKELKAILKSITKTALLLKDNFKELIQKANTNWVLQKKILSSINVLRIQLGLNNALKIWQLNKSKFYEWVLIHKLNCTPSILHK